MPFETLQELYDYLDEYAFKYISDNPYVKFAEPHQLDYKYYSPFINRTRVGTNFSIFSRSEHIDEETRKTAELEAFIFDLQPTGDEFHVNTLKKVGNEYVPCYNHEDITKNNLEFIKQRISKCKNHGMIEYYAQVVFLLESNKVEKEKYGKIAIDNYFLQASYIQTLGSWKSRVRKRIYDSVLEALSISKIIDYKKTEIREKLLSELKVLNHNIQSLIWTMIQEQSFFKLQDYKYLQNICLHLGVQALLIDKDLQWGETGSEYFESGLDISKIVGYKEYNWERLIKESRLVDYEEMDWDKSIFKELRFEKITTYEYQLVDIRNGEKLKILD